MASATLLSHVRSKVVVDVDSMDPNVAARHTTEGGPKFCDMTSNQAIVHGEAVKPERSALFRKACAQIRATTAELDIETQVSDIVDLLVR